MLSLGLSLHGLFSKVGDTFYLIIAINLKWKDSSKMQRCLLNFMFLGIILFYVLGIFILKKHVFLTEEYRPEWARQFPLFRIGGERDETRPWEN
jgi:hypothetical protein